MDKKLVCPDCKLPLITQVDVDDLASLWCECPILKIKPYIYDEDGEDGPD